MWQSSFGLPPGWPLLPSRQLQGSRGAGYSGHTKEATFQEGGWIEQVTRMASVLAALARISNPHRRIHTAATFRSVDGLIGWVNVWIVSKPENQIMGAVFLSHCIALLALGPSCLIISLYPRFWFSFQNCNPNPWFWSSLMPVHLSDARVT